jgi:STE24 endopeptidase
VQKPLLSKLLFVLIAFFAITAYAQQTSLAPITPAYSLPPAKLAKAIALNHAETWLDVTGLLWGFLSLLLILRLGVANWLNNFSASATSKPWLQGFVFLPLLLTLTSLLKLPFSIAGHHIALAFGLSIQHWPRWFGDWAKALALTIVAGRAPRLWWFWFWLISIPLTLASVYLVPVFIDPIFNHYQPLGQSNPTLVTQLERIVEKSGIAIPPSRMFLMKASEKVTTPNAYVTGFGASKRVVVWDTTIHSATPDGILFIFGHELGHYVLGHVVIGTVLGIAGTLIFLWLGYHLAHWMIRWRGQRWQVGTLADWSAVVVLLLAAQILGFVSSPIENGISRHFEHQADIYGEEVIHGIVADPQHTAQRSFQELGEDSLDLPHPNRLIVFWSYSHPTIFDRATFALHYDPWAPGHQPKYMR